jgi:hypothetical protein
MSALLGALLLLAGGGGDAPAAPGMDGLDRAAGILPLLAPAVATPSASQADAYSPQEGWEKWRGRQLHRTGQLFDFSRIELNALAGLVAYSSDFDADPELGAGVYVRVPAPGLFYPLPEIGVFAEVIVSRLEREPFYSIPVTKDEIIFGAIGLDYPFHLDKNLLVAGQIGLMYSDFGDVSHTSEGLALMAGAVVGWHVSHGFWLNMNPQLAYAPDTDDFVGFLFAGFQMEF